MHQFASCVAFKILHLNSPDKCCQKGSSKSSQIFNISGYKPFENWFTTDFKQFFCPFLKQPNCQVAKPTFWSHFYIKSGLIHSKYPNLVTLLTQINKPGPSLDRHGGNVSSYQWQKPQCQTRVLLFSLLMLAPIFVSVFLYFMQYLLSKIQDRFRSLIWTLRVQHSIQRNNVYNEQLKVCHKKLKQNKFMTENFGRFVG